MRTGFPATLSALRPLAALLVLAAALAGLLAAVPAAHAERPTDVVVEDTAGVLDLNALLPALREIEFHEPTKVAVYTRRGQSSDNFNEEVLRFARAEHPEWISADGQKWADGLYIFAIDPDGRHVGTYMGEDREVSLEQRESIQQDTFDLLRDAQWTDAVVLGVERGAALINRPWYRSPGVAIAGGVALGVGGLAGAGVLLHRAVNRRRFAEERRRGDESYANVTLDWETTALNANTIPSASRHGALVLERHRSFANDYAEVHRMRTQLENTTGKEASSHAAVQRAIAYADAAMRLDGLDDVVADANSLLNMGPGWPRAWDRQTATLRTDLAAVHDLAGHKAGDGAGERAAASFAALVAFCDTTRADLERWGVGLGDGSLGPDDALDAVAAARGRLAQLLERHAQAVIADSTANDDEAAKMREELERVRKGDGRPAPRGNGILDLTPPQNPWLTVAVFNAGFEAGTSSVAGMRSSASSTGYGSSGGSFSGSGSSSRF